VVRGAERLRANLQMKRVSERERIMRMSLVDRADHTPYFLCC
jgi:hypothetical protein